MDRLMATAWKYFIPLLVLGISVLTLIGDPNKPILKSLPIVPGQYQHEIAAALAVAAALLAFLVYRHEKHRPSSSR
jgi:hypothetical protein